MENPLNLLFTNFTLNIPVWFIIILMALPSLLFSWYRTNKLQIYGKLRFTEVTYNSLTVKWDRPIIPFPVPDHYKVQYRKHSEPESWDSIATRDGSCSLKITNVPIDTKFVVRVCACLSTEEGPFCDENSVITKNLAFKIKDESTPRKDTIPNSKPVYDIPYHVERNMQLKVRVIMIGEAPEENLDQVHKSVLFVSLPHSGKTTLLQGIMNFIFGVSSSDDFRLGFAPEITNKSNDYADWATVYQFMDYEGGRLGIPLTLIDIPRLQGQIKDHMLKIYEQLKYIASSYEQSINCICLVAPANIIRLNNEEIDFIQFIMYLFQTDSSTDLCCFFTFADAGPARVKNVLESHDVSFFKSYFLNWSAFFQKSGEFSCPFWNLNLDGLNDFLNQLKTSIPKPLRSSLESEPPPPVKREELKSDIAVLQSVNEGISNAVQMQSTVENFKEDKIGIKDSSDFSFTIEEIIQTKQTLEPGIHATHCTQCFITCHEKCSIPIGDEIIGCSSMRDGYCTVCTGHCIWSVHKTTPYTFHYTSVQVTKSYKEMKTNYEKEKGITLDYEAYLEQRTKDIEALLDRIRDKIRRITEYKGVLQGIARSPLAGTYTHTIDDMIKEEERKRATGFEKRIEMFRELKRYSEKFILIRIQL